jgi:sigma-B regulation protein RsbU (phosphoserine phosphatase)
MAFKKSTQAVSVQTEQHRITGLLNLVVILAIAAVAYTDWVVVANVSLGYLYVLPLALSALINPLPITVVLALICTGLTDIFGPLADTDLLRIFHNLISIAGFLIVSFLVTQIARQRDRMAAEVRRQRDEYARDLTLASQVQRQVLSKPPVIPYLQLAATMQTARMLGGDYYDFFKISDDIVDVVIADVSGKGAAASLLMPSLAVALRLRAHDLGGPAEIIKDLDGVIKQITNAATFVTMFYARLNQATRTLQYASGGHNPPLLLRSRTGKFTTLEEAGPILGILPDTQFANTTVSLEPGDILTLFTDGVTEQENPSEEEFSLDRLKQVILNNQTQPVAAITSKVVEAVTTFADTTEQSDDLTLVVIKVT